MSRPADIRPSPTLEEAAAIMAVLKMSRERAEQASVVSNWELSGRLGHVVPVGRKLESSPWSYPRLKEGF